MKEYTFPYLESLAPMLEGVDFFIVGEMHGVEENAELILSLINTARHKNRKILVAFEWLLHDDDLRSLREYIAGQQISTPVPPFFLDSDGRFTATHVKLLKYCRELNQKKEADIHITSFDTTSKNYEEKMASNLIEVADTIQPDIILVETGVVHARTNDSQKTLASILQRTQTVRTAFVRYNSGEVYLDGSTYAVEESRQQQLGPMGQFDCTIAINVAHPALPENLLTHLKNLYTVRMDQV